MISSQELRRILDSIYDGQPAAQLETPELDFKREKPSEKDAERALAEAAICFANSAGGMIVIGVADSPGGPDAFLGTELDPHALRNASGN